MKVRELMEVLGKADGEAEVSIQFQVNGMDLNWSAKSALVEDGPPEAHVVISSLELPTMVDGGGGLTGITVYPKARGGSRSGILRRK